MKMGLGGGGGGGGGGGQIYGGPEIYVTGMQMLGQIARASARWLSDCCYVGLSVR